MSRVRKLSPLAQFTQRALDPWDGRFSGKTLATSEKIWDTDRVRYRGKEDGVFTFQVQGNRDRPYLVEITKWGTEFFMHCTCPNGRRLGPRGECYHLAAVCQRITQQAKSYLGKRSEERRVGKEHA